MSDAVNELFGMSRLPFTADIPTGMLLMHERFRADIESLRYAVDNHLFTVVVSPPGCGKSTLLRALRDSLPSSGSMFLYISESRLTPRWLYNQILRQLGAREYYYRGDGRKAVHEQFAIVRELQRKQITVCVDEAHLLSLETIQELRFFLNTDMDSRSPVSLILAGQTELRGQLQKECFAAIRQRIAYPVVIDPMDRSLTDRYIKAHMTASGSPFTDCFSDEAVDAVFDRSGGIPRVVNQICGLCLMAAASKGTASVDSQTVEAVVRTSLI